MHTFIRLYYGFTKKFSKRSNQVCFSKTFVGNLFSECSLTITTYPSSIRPYDLGKNCTAVNSLNTCRCKRYVITIPILN